MLLQLQNCQPLDCGSNSLGTGWNLTCTANIREPSLLDKYTPVILCCAHPHLAVLRHYILPSWWLSSSIYEYTVQLHLIIVALLMLDNLHRPTTDLINIMTWHKVTRECSDKKTLYYRFVLLTYHQSYR